MCRFSFYMLHIRETAVRRRSATHAFCSDLFRGLKPTATGIAPLRGASADNALCKKSRSDDMPVAVGFNPRTICLNVVRRGATLDT